MTLEMRELKGDDLFTLLGIVGKLDIKDEFIQMFEENASSDKVVPMDKKKKEPTKKELEAKEAAAEKRGMEAMAGLLQKVLLNINRIKPEINGLLSDLTGEDLKTIQELGLAPYTGLLFGFFKKPELKDFSLHIASLLQG